MPTLFRRAAAVLVALLTVSTAAFAQDLAKVTAVVTVLSERAPATTLAASDFVIRDDGTKREAASADSIAQVPLHVVLVVDLSKPAMGVIPPVRDLRVALANFVSTVRAANPGAQIALYEVSGAAVPRVKFDAPEADLDAALARMAPGQNADAPMLEGIIDAARSLKQVPSIRRAIVSVDFGSSDPSAENSNKLVLDELIGAQTSLFAVTIRGTSQGASRRDAGLNYAVEVTGGTRLTAVSATGLDAQMRTLANTLSSQYLVTFMRPAGMIRKLAIETSKGQKAFVGALLR